MVLQHVWGLFTNPKREWEAIRDDECTIGKCYAIHVLILAAIPAISGFIGTTQFGWQIGVGDPVKLTLQSAGLIAVASWGLGHQRYCTLGSRPPKVLHPGV